MERLIQTERKYLFAPSINVSAVLQFEGTVSKDNLYFAIKTAMRHHEILCSKVKIKETGEAYFEMPSEPKYAFIQMHKDWERIIKEQERMGFELENGEYIRFFFHENKWGTLLLMSAHRMIGDIPSFVYILEDILKALHGEKLSYKKIIPAQIPSIKSGKKSLKHVSTALLKEINKSNKQWEKKQKVFDFKSREHLSKDFWKQKVTDIYYEQIEKPVLKEIIWHCKNKQISLQAYFAAILAKVWMKTIDLNLSLDLREEKNKAIGDFEGKITIRFLYDKNKEFWDNAKTLNQMIEVKDQTQRVDSPEFREQICPTLLDGTYFAAFEGFDNKTAIALAETFGFVQNPTKIQFMDLKNLSFSKEAIDGKVKEFFLVPPLPVDAKVLLSASIFHGNMTLIYHFQEEYDMTVHEKIFYQLLDEIHNTVK